MSAKHKPTTVKAMLEACRKFGAGTMKSIFKDSDGRPIAAVVVIDGREACEELLPIIEEVEERWDKEGEKWEGK